MFTKADLQKLIDADAEPAVSLFLPTHIAGREIAQDPIRLKNLLAEVENRLLEAGHRRPHVADLLKPAYALVKDMRFWRHQSSGLAVFIAPDIFRVHRVPLVLDEQAFVGRAFQIKPLLPLLSDDGRFFLLTVSLARTRVFQGSKFTLNEMEGEEVPAAFMEIMKEADYEDMRHHHPLTALGSAPGGAQSGSTVSHNFGNSPEDQRYVQLIEYFRRLASAVDALLADERAPLVLACDDKWQGYFREYSKYPLLMNEGLAINPDAFEEASLHKRAYSVVKPYFGRIRREGLGRYDALANDGDDRAARDIARIVPHARFGRVDTLFVANDTERWGRFDAETAKVELHDQRKDGDEDMLDRAVVYTLQSGGQVFVLPGREIPFDSEAVAILRY